MKNEFRQSKLFENLTFSFTYGKGGKSHTVIVIELTSAIVLNVIHGFQTNSYNYEI